MAAPYAIVDGGLIQDSSSDVKIIDLDEYEHYGDVDFERFTQHWETAIEIDVKWVIERLTNWVQNHPDQEQARDWCEDNNVPWKGEAS